MNPMRDKNEGECRGGGRKTPVTTAFPRRSLRVKDLLRVELEGKSDSDYKKKIGKVNDTFT